MLISVVCRVYFIRSTAFRSSSKPFYTEPDMKFRRENAKSFIYHFSLRELMFHIQQIKSKPPDVESKQTQGSEG